MTITFNKSQRAKIRKFLEPFHGKEHTDLYDVFRTVANLVYTGCQWQMLPTCYLRPTTGYYHFRRWSESNNLILFLECLVSRKRRKTGRKAKHTVAVVDSQSVRSEYSQSHKGVDGFKKVKGIKRHMLRYG